MLADLRYALRALRKSPGFTLVSILTGLWGLARSGLIFLQNRILPPEMRAASITQLSRKHDNIFKSAAAAEARPG